MNTLQKHFDLLWSRGHDWKVLSDKGTDHSYIEIYDEILKEYTNNPINFLEIGIGFGSCLEMWTNYFHKDSKIYGFDIEDFQIFKDYGTIYYGDSKSEETRDAYFNDITFDVIIEDGEHTISSQLATFDNYYKLVKPGGLYIIEDVQHLEQDLEEFHKKGYYPKVYDLRGKKGRHDDVLFVFIKNDNNPKNNEFNAIVNEYNNQ
jgi:ubiquinone/menaquinone biosynthesis C-methylase UbiE